MSMPLAFNFEGDAFEVPPTAVGWRVKRMRTKGAPELVYSSARLRAALPPGASVPTSAPLRFQLVPLHHLERSK